jgi:hypothetical protein
MALTSVGDCHRIRPCVSKRALMTRVTAAAVTTVIVVMVVAKMTATKMVVTMLAASNHRRVLNLLVVVLAFELACLRLLLAFSPSHLEYWEIPF